VIITDPNEVCRKCVRKDVIQLTGGIEFPEFLIKLLNIFAGRRGVNLSDVRLDAADGFSL
jgi:hypothetical protein